MKRIILYIFFILIIIISTGVYVQNKVLSSVLAEKIVKLNRSEDISCHYIVDRDSLPAAEDATFADDSIYFHETSCTGGLNSRQACAIESAARAHPNRSVYVLFSGSITDTALEKSCLSVLRRLNVTFFRVHLPDYVIDTGLEHILLQKILRPDAASWRMEHAADILRFITLYRYGGVYLDTDMIIVKSLDDLGKNFAGRESERYINVAAMGVDKDGEGHKLLDTILRNVASDYQSNAWSYNGPGVLTRTLEKYCDDNTKISQFSAKTCKGFNVVNEEVFYPIPFPAFKKYFELGDYQKYKKSYGFHFWNRMSHDTWIKKGSILYRLAEKYCPDILKFYGNFFGI